MIFIYNENYFSLVYFQMIFGIKLLSKFYYTTYVIVDNLYY